VNLIVDTGSYECTIDQSLIKELNVPCRLPRLEIFPDETCYSILAIVPKLQLGKLTIRSLPIAIHDLHAFSANSGFRVDGILGILSVGNLVMTFDDHKNILVFEDCDKFVPPPKAFEIPTTGNRPSVSAKVNGKIDESFVIDTGANVSMLPKTLLTKLVLPVLSGGEHTYASGKPRKQGWTKISELALGKLKLENTWFSTDISGGNAANTAVLGNDLLSNFRLTLSPLKHLLFLESYPSNTVKKVQNQANAFLAIGKYKEVIDKLNPCINREPNNVELLKLRAQAQYWLRQYGKCAEDSTQIIQPESRDSDIYFMRALAYEKLGQHNLAIKDCLKIASLSPDDPFAILRCSNCLSAISENKKAIDQLNKALKLQSDIVQLYLARADAFEHENNYQKALQDCDAAIKLNPNRAESYNYRAWILNASGNNFDKAIEDSNKAISLDPNSAGPYRNRAIAYIGKSDYSKALPDLDNSLTLDSTSERAGRTYYFRSIVYDKLGKHDLAKQDESMYKKLDYNPKED